MKPTQALTLSALTLVFAAAFAAPAAHAGDEQAGLQAPRFGDHPAVLIARKGVQHDPTMNFYLHPARLSWSLQRPLSDGEHPAVLVAHREPTGKIDPNQFILAHPAGGAPTSQTQ
jgi:hypothetical protein